MTTKAQKFINDTINVAGDYLRGEIQDTTVSLFAFSLIVPRLIVLGYSKLEAGMMACLFVATVGLLGFSDTAKCQVVFLQSFIDRLKELIQEGNERDRDAIRWLNEHFKDSKNIPDPLALDLDGNGISFTKNGAYFDLGTDGFAERATWIGKGDGLLALDKNNDGKINNGSELFGDAMRKKDGTLAKDGFDALADYDLNKDGKIDAADDVYSKLRVWVDANGDGVTDDGELKTLAELGIRQLNLGNTAGNGVVNATGEVLQKQGSFIWENCAVRDEFVFQLEHRKIPVLQRGN